MDEDVAPLSDLSKDRPPPVNGSLSSSPDPEGSPSKGMTALTLKVPTHSVTQLVALLTQVVEQLGGSATSASASVSPEPKATPSLQKRPPPRKAPTRRYVARANNTATDGSPGNGSPPAPPGPSNAAAGGGAASKCSLSKFSGKIVSKLVSAPSASDIAAGPSAAMKEQWSELVEKSKKMDSEDYREQPPEKLIASSPDIRRMLADVKKAQIRLAAKHDYDKNGRVDGKELKLALGAGSLGRKAQQGQLKRSSTLAGVLGGSAAGGAPAAAPSAVLARAVAGGSTTSESFKSRMLKAKSELIPTFDGPRYMVSPNEPWRRVWDMASLFFTASTIIILPFQFAFSADLERDVPILLLSALSDLFFLVDILVNFRTGYIDSRGNLDADPKRAARRYLRTWFCPDALAAAFPLDLIGLILLAGSSDGVSDEVESVGLLQSFRTLRILRLSKFVRILGLLANRGGLDVEGIDPSIITMSKTLFFQFLFWHWSGLLWWVIGGEGQVDDGFGPEPALSNVTLVQKYMACMYWTIAITSKVREPMPNMDRDYAPGLTFYANLVIMLGLLFQALLVGSASSVVQNMDSAAALSNRQIKTIRNYLEYIRVPTSLKKRITQYYQFKWSKTGSMDQSQVLPDLPAPLKAQMDIAYTRSLFVSIPVFQACEPHEMLQMVQGLTYVLALPGDVLIPVGEVGRGLFFILRGGVEFVAPKPTLTTEQMAKVRSKFDDFDADGSGSINVGEMSNAIKSLGYEVRKKELAAMIADIDQDGSGEIEFDEFIEMLVSNQNFLEVIGGATLNLTPTIELTEGFFGEESVLTGKPSSSTIRAFKHSDFFLLPVDIFNSVASRNEKMHQLIMEYARARGENLALQSNQRGSFKQTCGWKKIRTAVTVGAAIKSGGATSTAKADGGGATQQQAGGATTSCEA